MSRNPLYFYPAGFSSFCSPVPNDTPITTLTLEELCEQYKIPSFTHLVADCEGGLMDFFEENKEFVSRLEGVYFEKDSKRGMKVDYNPILSFLQDKGFVCKKTGFREYWERTKENLSSELADYCQANATNPFR